MKARTKAKELFKKYSKGKDEHGWSLCEFDSCAKQCALIAVDELIESTLPSCEFGGEINNNTIEYWIEVKQELEKL